MSVRTGHPWHSPRLRQFSWMALAVAISAANYFAGREYQFPIVFLLPIALAAWYEGWRWGMVLAIALPLVRLSFHFAWFPGGPSTEAYVNAAVRILIFGMFALLIAKTRTQSVQLQARVSALEGIVPMCSACKKIRNEQGIYEPVEKYIQEHSNAQLSHGLCNECLAALYPEQAKAIRSRTESPE